MDAASADVFGAVVRIAGLAVRDRLARSLLLTRNTGTTPGVHASDFAVHFFPNANEITICLGEKKAELSDACRDGVRGGNEAAAQRGRYHSISQPHHKIEG